MTRWSLTLRGIALPSVALALAVAGCTPVGIAVGAGATVATAAAEERGLATAADDTWLYSEINRKWLEYDHRLPVQATATVREGKALLTGVVDTTDMRREAVRLAWEVDGLTQVINELRVNGETTLASNDTGDSARDLWIAKTLETRLLFDSEVVSINYNVDVAARVVYLMGIAQNQTELNRVIAHARDIEHVRKVVSYVRLLAPKPASSGTGTGS